jgi:hypothetical protein
VAILIFFLVWILILGLLVHKIAWWMVVIFWVSFLCFWLIYRHIKGRLP